ncbi:MAG: surface-adhesin E family protein [Pseudomonadota bacterium]
MINFKPVAFMIAIATSSILAGAAWAADEDGKWRIYSEEPNGDVHFFDPSRVEKSDSAQKVWSRIRYKTSIMGAASYQSLLEIDCSERTEKILQNTFFSDRQWERPAMSTDRSEKPKKQIVQDSAVWRLSEILCEK